MKNNKILILSLLFSCGVYAADFVSPIDFEPTKENKDKVIKYIKQNVEQTYSKIGMDNPTTLRMMEQEELKAFKKLTQAKNAKMLEKIKKQYCKIGMCTYSTISMMYDEEIKASNKELTW